MGSALLAPGTRAAWEHIQRSEGGAARLLRGFEAYFSNVARNVRRTYLRPFVIVTANMSEGRGLARGWVCPTGGTPGPSGVCGPSVAIAWGVVSSSGLCFLVCEMGRRDSPRSACAKLIRDTHTSLSGPGSQGQAERR